MLQAVHFSSLCSHKFLLIKYWIVFHHYKDTNYNCCELQVPKCCKHYFFFFFTLELHDYHTRTFSINIFLLCNRLSPELDTFKKARASENYLTFTSEWTKVTTGPEWFFNFTLLLYDGTSNDAGSTHETNARPTKLNVKSFFDLIFTRTLYFPYKHY